MNLQTLKNLGFDLSKRSGPKHYSVHCSQCHAVTINGVPVHEQRCPNERHECKGCNAIVPARQKYCVDCAGF